MKELNSNKSCNFAKNKEPHQDEIKQSILQHMERVRTTAIQ